MNEKRMPVIFSGHGSPMLALEDTEVTRGLRAIGDEVLEKFGRPKGILAVSAHWYAYGTYVQTEEEPKQVYDMYGFPQELYDFKYPVKGSRELGSRALELINGAAPGGIQAGVNNDWGIDHGTWTVLCHMFPKADIPVVQLTVDASASPEALYGIGQALAPLRDEGYLIFASGNVVHNLSYVEWDNKGGSKMTEAFNKTVRDLVLERDDKAVMDYKALPYTQYAVPTPEHYLPLIYMLGAAKGEKARVFNDHCELGSIAMTGFAFGL